MAGEIWQRWFQQKGSASFESNLSHHFCSSRPHLSDAILSPQDLNLFWNSCLLKQQQATCSLPSYLTMFLQHRKKIHLNWKPRVWEVEWRFPSVLPSTHRGRRREWSCSERNRRNDWLHPCHWKMLMRKTQAPACHIFKTPRHWLRAFPVAFLKPLLRRKSEDLGDSI